MGDKYEDYSSLKACLITNAAFESGIGAYVAGIYEKFKSHGMKVRLVCTDPLIRDPDVIILNKKSIFPLNHFLNYFVNPTRIPRGYDVYHVTTQSIGIFAKFNRPSIVTVHDVSIFVDKKIMQPAPSFLSPKTKKVYENAFFNSIYYRFAKKSSEASKYADKIICQSNFTKKELIKYLRVPSNKISVIYTAVDHNRFKPRNKEDARLLLNLPQDYTLLLNVGDEGRRKNITAIIQALSLLVSTKKMNKILLIRIGEKREVTQTLIRDLKVDDKVVYYTGVSKEIFPYFYNASDLLLYPSFYEGFGLPPLEAMASGCPVIASDRSAIPEIVQDGGVLIPPTDVELLANTILECLENRNLMRELVERGLNRALDFSFDKCAHNLFEEYERTSRGLS
ncbi:MAG: glycosyltransferase family 4 protein [archaeon]|nr:glycosyltransferase family 4 protein [archaeon]